MNIYIKFIKDLIHKYNSFEKDWDKEIEKANDCVLNPKDLKQRFINNKPHFYSGRLLNIEDINNLSLIQEDKYIFLSMNPYSDLTIKRICDREPIELEQFLLEQNTLFDTYEKYHPFSYALYEKLIGLIKNENVNNNLRTPRYPLLAKYAIVIDWFPFYSQKFKINLKKNTKYPETLLKDILNGIQELKNAKIFAIGVAMEAILSKICEMDNNQKFNTENQKRIKVFKLNNNNQKIFSFPLASKSNEYFNDIAKFFRNID